MRKIFITGNAGSGKTTLSKILGKQLDLPVYSLDQIVWKPRWKKPPASEKNREIKKLLNKKSWIIDGVSTDVMKAADTVVFLDFLGKCAIGEYSNETGNIFSSLDQNCQKTVLKYLLLKDSSK